MLPDTVRATDSSTAVHHDAQVCETQSVRTDEVVTTAEFYDALFRDDAPTLAGWLSNKKIGTELLGSRNTNDTLHEPLFVYLAKSPKPNCAALINQLIKMADADQLESTDANGWTPLMIAAKRGNGRILRQLAERGANPNAVDALGRNVAMLIAETGADRNAVRVVQYLCRNGLHINAQDKEGNTALHHAAENFGYQIVAPLIAVGADTRIKNNDDMTALDLAKQADPDGIEQDHDLECNMVALLTTSRTEMLAHIGALFGEAIRADLLWISERLYQAFADTVEYTLGVHLETVASALVDQENLISVVPPDQISGPSYAELERRNEPVDEVQAAVQTEIQAIDEELDPVEVDVQAIDEELGPVEADVQAIDEELDPVGTALRSGPVNVASDAGVIKNKIDGNTENRSM